MGGFFQGLGNVAKKGFELTNTGQRLKDSERRRLDEDNEFVELVQGKGAKFALNGMVDEGGVLRKADPSRIIKHKTADGKTVMFELPTAEEQIRSNADRLMQQFQAQAPVREGQANEAISNAGRTRGAQNSADSAATDADRERNGIPLTSLESIFPGISAGGAMPRPAAAAPMSATSDPGQLNVREPRKALPTEFDDLVRAGANLENIKSLIADRGKKPQRQIKATKEIEDDAGNVTEVITYDDGTVEEKKLTAKGKKTKPTGSAGGLTAYQQLQEKNRQEDKAAKKVDTRQAELEALQAQEDGLLSANQALLEQRAKLKNSLGFTEAPDEKNPGKTKWVKGGEGDAELTPTNRGSAALEISKLEGQIKGNAEKVAALQKKKASVDAIRKSLIGQTESATAGAQGAAAAAVDANPIRYNAKGDAIQWNGKQWAPVKAAAQ